MRFRFAYLNGLVAQSDLSQYKYVYLHKYKDSINNLFNINIYIRFVSIAIVIASKNFP